jgi:methylenetetrahydrofolate dehydrogenase (NADP+)/methenyltetrahydrofolate cyclohydrolase
MGGIIDGKAVAKAVRTEVKREVKSFRKRFGRGPGLNVILVGEDPASKVYVGKKEQTSARLGFESRVDRLSSDIPREKLLELVHAYNEDSNVDGILVQLPLPDHIDEDEIVAAIDPAKDVDGLHTMNMGRLLRGEPGPVPCTPLGIMQLLKHSGVELKGKRAVVVGRSNIVGKPAALLLQREHATVTMCHSRTADLSGEIGRADIVVAAIGRPEFIKGEWVKPGAVVIDVGVNRMEEKLVGDVEFEPALERASLITPVPGGVGPMTIACLMRNTLDAATRREEGLA